MLEVSELGVRYGRHVAVQGVSARVGKGEICVVLGANGAGKSSLLKAVAGMVKKEPGSRVVMNGRDISGLKPHSIVEEGIALVPEGRGIFGELTVAENLQLGAFARRARSTEKTTLDNVYHLFPRLAERRRQVARTMSGGEQQMVAIGRALMSRPDVLMLDEPSLGLSPLLSKELFRSLSAIAGTGVGVLLVEQNAKLSLKIASRGYLIENGLITGEDSAAALMRDPAVINAYLGGAGRGGAKTVSLPPGFALPSGLEGIGRLVGDIAARAGAIQQAFVRAIRRDGPAASAFVGRYDARKEPDPWAQVATAASAWKPSPAIVSDQARSLASEAEDLSRRAAERLAAHVRSGRLSAGVSAPLVIMDPASAQREPDKAEPPAPPPVVRNLLGPSAVPPSMRRHAVDAESLARDAATRVARHVLRAREVARGPAAFTDIAFSSTALQTLDPAALAERATARLAAHVRSRRAAAKPGIAGGHPVPPQAIVVLDRSHPLIGHNSAGIAEAETEEPKSTGLPAADAADIGGLAVRAAAIAAAHLAERRKSLSVFRYPARLASAPEENDTTDPAKKKRKKRKEA